MNKKEWPRHGLIELQNIVSREIDEILKITSKVNKFYIYFYNIF
jgi:hypothetical protein